MKKLILSLVATAAISLSSFGQAPEGFKYQAVVRDAGNTILNNQAVGMRVTIQQGSIGGTTVYQETFAPTTNAYGLLNLEIGSGTVVSGDFTTIDWSAGPYFIETAVDVAGGTSYQVMGTSELMSVPYALHANTAENVTNDMVDDADNDPYNEIELPAGGLEGQVLTISGGIPQWVTPTAPASNIQDSLDLGITPCQLTALGLPVDSLYGKTWAGGLIFYFDAFLCEGLVAAPTEQSVNAPWGCNGSQVAAFCSSGINHQFVFCQSPCSDPGSASEVCTGLINGYNDWFLPTLAQLDLMYHHLFLRGLGDFDQNEAYWSSTEVGNFNAWLLSFGLGQHVDAAKIATAHVRAVRAF